MSGELYVEECVKNNRLFHGIIIDCTDYEVDENNIVLFDKLFYNNINKILINNGYLTQQFNTIDNLITKVDNKYKLCYPKLELFNKYHFEHVNCFSYGSPTYMLHLIKRKKVSINGSGMAGLILAKLLKENGNYEVDLYEKTNKLGGKFSTKLVDNNYIFNGAEYVHGEKSLMYDLIKSYNLLDELIEIECKVITNIELKTTNQVLASTNINDISDDEKIIMICHEFCMDIENIDYECIDIENSNWTCGEKNYLINDKIYSTIMNDLQKYPDNIYYNSTIEADDINNYDFCINAYAPNNFTKLCHSAIKIFFKIDDIAWDKTQSILFAKNIMDIDVVEIWKNGLYFVLFATASRAIKINNLLDKHTYIKLVMEDILKKSVNISIIDINFFEYGYHYPFKKIIPNNYCGEWTSDVFDSSLSGAIQSAYNMYNYIIKK